MKDLLPRAKAWILANKDNREAAVQPWDRKNHRIPGGKAGSPGLTQLIIGAPILLRQKTRGLLPAPEKILDCAVEAARLDFDTALTIESRRLAYLAVTPEAKNQNATFFFAMNKVNSGASRPRDIEPGSVKRVGVLGAGMMGQGIAYVSAMAGIEVVLKDISLEAANKGKAYAEALRAIFDEVSLKLTHKAQQTWRELGMLDKFGDQSISRGVVDTLVGEYGRGG